MRSCVACDGLENDHEWSSDDDHQDHSSVPRVKMPLTMQMMRTKATHRRMCRARTRTTYFDDVVAPGRGRDHRSGAEDGRLRGLGTAVLGGLVILSSCLGLPRSSAAPRPSSAAHDLEARAGVDDPDRGGGAADDGSPQPVAAPRALDETTTTTNILEYARAAEEPADVASPISKDTPPLVAVFEGAGDECADAVASLARAPTPPAGETTPTPPPRARGDAPLGDDADEGRRRHAPSLLAGRRPPRRAPSRVPVVIVEAARMPIVCESPDEREKRIHLALASRVARPPPPAEGEAPPPSDGEAPPADGEAPPADSEASPPPLERVTLVGRLRAPYALRETGRPATASASATSPVEPPSADPAGVAAVAQAEGTQPQTVAPPPSPRVPPCGEPAHHLTTTTRPPPPAVSTPPTVAEAPLNAPRAPPRAVVDIDHEAADGFLDAPHSLQRPPLRAVAAAAATSSRASAGGRCDANVRPEAHAAAAPRKGVFDRNATSTSSFVPSLSSTNSLRAGAAGNDENDKNQLPKMVRRKKPKAAGAAGEVHLRHHQRQLRKPKHTAREAQPVFAVAVRDLR